jgi:hypothetical protein
MREIGFWLALFMLTASAIYPHIIILAGAVR